MLSAGSCASRGRTSAHVATPQQLHELASRMIVAELRRDLGLIGVPMPMRGLRTPFVVAEVGISLSYCLETRSKREDKLRLEQLSVGDPFVARAIAHQAGDEVSTLTRLAQLTERRVMHAELDH